MRIRWIGLRFATLYICTYVPHPAVDFTCTKVLELFLQIAFQTERKSYGTKYRCLNHDLVYINLAEIQVSALLSTVAQVQILQPKKHIEGEAQALLLALRIGRSTPWTASLELWRQDSTVTRYLDMGVTRISFLFSLYRSASIGSPIEVMTTPFD
jgi:hypothetical protein